MSEHIRTEDVHDWLDGLLPAPRRMAFDRHVEACPACAAEVARWSEVVGAVRALPDAVEPERDLWAGIEARLEDREASKAIAPPATPGLAAAGAGSPRRRGPRRVSLTFTQLWAAGLALALATGSLVWVAGGGPASGAEQAMGTPDAVRRPEGVRSVAVASEQYDQAVIDLEALLEEGRDVLAPETVRAIEESLATVDRAIAEAEAALASDPASSVLNRLLMNHRQTKLRILRQATTGLLPRA